MVAPAPSRRCTAAAVSPAGGCVRSQSGWPNPVRCPATWKTSLAAKESPARGPFPAPASAAWLSRQKAPSGSSGGARRCRRREVAHIRLRIPRATFPGRFPNPASPEPNAGRRTSLRRKAPGGSSGAPPMPPAGGRSRQAPHSPGDVSRTLPQPGIAGTKRGRRTSLRRFVDDFHGSGTIRAVEFGGLPGEGGAPPLEPSQRRGPARPPRSPDPGRRSSRGRPICPTASP